jgi:hypothetical protein
MYYIGLDVHKRTISYFIKDAAGHVHREGKIGSSPPIPHLRYPFALEQLAKGYVLRRQVMPGQLHNVHAIAPEPGPRPP